MISKTAGGHEATGSEVSLNHAQDRSAHARLLTVVHCQNLPAIHFNKTAEGKLSMLDPSLLRPLEGDALATQTKKPLD